MKTQKNTDIWNLFAKKLLFVEKYFFTAQNELRSRMVTDSKKCIPIV